MEYFKGFEEVLKLKENKSKKEELINLYGELLEEFGKQKFKHTKKCTCICRKRYKAGSLNIYLGDSKDYKEGLVLYYDDLSNFIRIGKFKTIEEFNKLMKDKLKIIRRELSNGEI